MRDRLAHRKLLFIRTAIIAVCFIGAFVIGYPPGLAQRATYRIQTIPVITTEDALQDQHLDDQEKHLSSNDARIDDLKKHQEETDSHIANWSGAFSATLIIVTILSGWGISLQIKQKHV
jgi:hypothetical protein